MNLIKKILGLIIMILSPIALFYLCRVGINEMNAKQSLDAYIQWTIFIVVFIPIIIGFFLFGWYSWKGEYKI